MAYQGVLRTGKRSEESEIVRVTEIDWVCAGSEARAIVIGTVSAMNGELGTGGAPSSVYPTAGTEAAASAVIANPAEMSCSSFMTPP